MTRLVKSVTALVVASALAAPAAADLVVGPVAVIRNDFGSHGAFPIGKLMNKSGLSTNYTPMVTDFDSYNATHSAGSSDDWVSQTGPGVGKYIDFDLGSTLGISQFALWNDSETGVDTMRSVNEFRIYTDNDSNFSTAVDVGTFVAANPGAAASSSKLSFDLANSVGQYVRLEIISNYGDGLIQIGEVAFGVVAVPEPAAPLTMGLLFASVYFWPTRRLRAA